MNPNTSLDKIIKHRLYHWSQFFIASIIGGPVVGSFIIALNLWAKQKKSLSIIPILLGLLFDFLMIVAAFFSSRYIDQILMRNLLAVGLLFLMQFLLALAAKSYFKKASNLKALIFKNDNEQLYHRRKTFPIILVSLIYFVTDLVFPFFSWLFLIVFLIPHFYFYIRIHKHYTSLISKVFLSCLFIFASIVPLIYAAGEIAFAIKGGNSIYFSYINYGVGIYLVFILNILLIIIGLQIIKLLFFWLPSLRFKKRVLFKLVSITIFSGLITAFGFHVNNTPLASNYSITIPKQNSTLDSLKVICISDLHLKQTTHISFLKDLVKKINIIEPDIILIPGDLLEYYGAAEAQTRKLHSLILSDLKPKYGTYISNGNHDFRNQSIKDFDFFHQKQTVILNDSLIEVDQQFYILGLEYRGKQQKRPIESLLQSKSKNLPVFLLDHAPYGLEASINKQIDIQFSGHTHRGQLFPFNYIVDAVFELPYGYQKFNNTHVFVSSGLQDALMPGRQNVSLPVRTYGSSEIMIIKIKFQ